MATFDLAAGGLERAEQEREQGRLAGTVRARDRDALAAVEGEVDVAQHRRGAAVGVDAAQQRDAAAAVGGGVELEADGRGFPRALDPRLGLDRALEAVLARAGLLRDLLGIALLLVGAHAAGAPLAAAGVVAGVGDVGLEAPAPLLLGLDELLEARAAAGTLGAVVAVAALVGLERAAGSELVDALDDGVEEVPVVRDDQQRAAEVGEEALEPREAVAVEVVGGLVEQQHLRVLEQRRRQQRARLLAAGEAVQRAVAGQVVDREPPPDLLGARLRGPGAGRLGALQGVGVAVEVARARAARRAPSPASPSASRSRLSSVASPAGASWGR